MTHPHQPDAGDRSDPDRPPRSSVVPLNVAKGEARPATGDDVPTVIGANPLAAPPPTDAFALAAGSTLAHFEIGEPLGAGGMATVYKARDLTLGREVALKILPPALARDPDAVTRFKLEARAAALLNHDAVARVFYTGEADGLHFIAFEFVDGETLRAMIDRLGTVPPADCVRYLLDVAAGLHHASGRGVVHRDVKPSNIVITAGGRAKLIDMGLARSAAVNGGVTQSGTTLGTFDYISPEQAIDPRTADVRSDIYSLGCTCYHAVTGRPPVPDGNAARKLAAHQTEQPTDPRFLNPAVPDELAGALDRMMAKAPAHRHQTAAELIADLSAVARKLGVEVSGSEVRPASGVTPVVPPKQPHNWPWIAAGVGILAAAVVVASVWPRPADPPVPPWTDPPPANPRPGPAIEVTANDPPTPATPPKAIVVATVDELVKAVQDGVPKITLPAGATFDLTATAGLVVSGKQIEWDCPADPKAAVVRVAASTMTKAGEARAGGLTFHKCDGVTIRGVRFELVQPADDPAADPVGVVFADVGTVDLLDSTVEAGDPLAAADGTGGQFLRVNAVTAQNCFFGLGAWTGVELNRVKTAAFTECGFVSARDAIEVANDGADRTAVTLRHSTFLLNAAAAVTVRRDARCDVTAGYCVFATPAPDPIGRMPTDPDRRSAVLRGSPDATFTTPDRETNAAFQTDPPPAVSGDYPEVLKAAPWAMTTADDPAAPWTALRLNPKLKPLRPTAPGVIILGARSLPTARQKLYDGWPLASLTAGGVKVWYPHPTAAEKDDLPANVYTDLPQAVAALRGKDVLLIRGSGQIEVPQPAVLTDPKRAVTVRAEPGSNPVLVPVGEGRRDATVFRLEGGELTLDGLRFLVRPRGTDGTGAAVTVSGGRRCELKGCVVTLDESDDERAAAVNVLDASDLMMKDTAVRPAVGFENCLVRGRGRLVRSANTPAMDVTASNVAAAVSGPLFEFGPPRASAPMVTVQLTHLTAVLGGPLFDVKAGRKATDDKLTHPAVDVRADNCLIQSIEAGAHPLLQLPQADAGRDPGLTWAAGPAGNGFAGWATYAEMPEPDGGDLKRWDAADWRRVSGERESAFGRLTLTKPPTAKTLTAVRPADLEPFTSGFADDLGAKTKLLPKADE
jgi:serine/threonine protein kinase